MLVVSDHAPAIRRSRVAPAHCCAGAPSEPCVRLSPHTAQASPEGVAGWCAGFLRWRARRLRWQEACIRRVRVPSGVPCPSVVDEVVGGDRPADHAQPPPFPFAGGIGWLVGGEQGVPAERTAAVLPGEQAQVVAVQRGFDLRRRRAAQ